MKKNVLLAAAGVAAVALGFAVARRASTSILTPVGASLDDCVGQPPRYARLLKPRLRLRLRRRPRS